MSEDRLVALCTVPDAETAAAIAARLVQDRLAACVNVLPGIMSVYTWQGEVQQDSEQLLIIKTRQSVFEALQKAVCELHPYELPEVIAVAIADGLPGYLSWIDDSTGS
ncbi:MAG: divalent-cation tolerance protein CutA [Gammaproteobacteria bacterium]